jgi:hypothetical protein
MIQSACAGNKKERREVSPDNVLSGGSPRLSNYSLDQSPYPVSNPAYLFRLSANTNSLNPKHPRQMNDCSEIHLNPRDSIVESLNQ